MAHAFFLHIRQCRKEAAMTQGERIKYIRNSRKMTQKQLGFLCGFSENTADVRIRQYESNAKAPKQDTLMLIAEALQVSYIAIKNYDLGAAEDILETLFWLDIQSGIELFPLQPEHSNDGTWNYKGSCNEPADSATVHPPFGIVIQYGSVNDFLAEWALRKEELRQGVITSIQYNNWKWNWPNSCDDVRESSSYVDWKNI